MSTIETVIIVHPKDPKATMKINLADFDPQIHKRLDVKPAEQANPKTKPAADQVDKDKGQGDGPDLSSLAALDVADDVKAALVKAGFDDVKAIAKLTDKAFAEMVEKAGLSESQDEALFDAVTKLKD